MCAIAGIFNNNRTPVTSQSIKQMTDVMSHRGPDDEGIYISKNLGLGHRRLAIIDLTPTARQPMANEDETIWLVFNGEIYNYQELRLELIGKGHRFRSESDSEVILHSYEEWGETCVERFNGMWALALWDTVREALFLSRDRCGEKPLYYYSTANTFFFASEIKGILAVHPEARRPNYLYLYRFLVWAVQDEGEETFFEGIKQVLPGHSMVVDQTGLRHHRYWDVDPETACHRYDYSSPDETFRDLLQDSIRLRLRSDVPVGSCLSGGLDSSTIVSVVSGMLDHPIKTFSCTYEDVECNEFLFVDEVNKYVGAEPYVVSPDGKDLFDVLPKIVWHQDEPSLGPGLYSQWHVMRAAQGRAKVLLDGQGADELLGGYHEYFKPYLVSVLNDFVKSKNVSHLLSVVRSLWGIYRLNVHVRFHRERLSKYLLGVAHGRNIGKFDKCTQPLHQEFVSMFHGYKVEPYYPDRFENVLNNTLYWDLVRHRLPALLHYEDRNSMANSIEARTPFLDHRLVEFALGLPYDWKIRLGVTKIILRKAYQHRLPFAVSHRKDKKGYPTPMARWFRTIQRENLMQFLFSEEVRRRRIFNLGGIKVMIDKHCNGDIDASWQIYRWLTTEIWFRIFID